MESNQVVLLTGLPRSGSTLVCHLLSSIPDVVALHEPMQVGKWRGLSWPQMHEKIETFVAENRRSLQTTGTAISKHCDGEVPDNPIQNQSADLGLRQSIVKRGEIQLKKALPPDFLLAIKHNAAFAALLEYLAIPYACFAIVRNPLAVLGSWQTVDIPVREGRIPAAEAMIPELRAKLESIPNRIDRQFLLLDWFFGQFARFVPPNRILRYEEVIVSGGRSLQSVCPGATDLNVPLESRNQNPVYDSALLQELGERLLNSSGSYWKFYSKTDVEMLMRTPA